MLYTFQHGGTLRSMAFVIPPDWFDHLPLRLMVFLHPDGTSVDAFVTETRVEAVLQYDALLPGAPLPPLTLPPEGDKPKFVALFPVGLGRTDQLLGGWKSGHLGDKDVGMMDIDDVSFVFACIERLESFLANHYFDTLKEWPGPIVDEARRYAVGGPGTGGQLCYRLAAERPGFFRAIAPVGCTPSGWVYAFQDTVIGLPPVNFAAAADDPKTSVLHLHGEGDIQVGWNGDSSAHNDDVLAYIEGGDPGYMRVDSKLNDLNDPNGIGSLWANAANGWSAAKGIPAALDLNGATLNAASAQWTFQDLLTGEEAIVRLLIVQGAPAEEAHAWPVAATTFDGLAVIWNFFMELELR